MHAVGGLRDTVKPFNPFENTGTGAGALCSLPALLARCVPAAVNAGRRAAQEPAPTRAACWLRRRRLPVIRSPPLRQPPLHSLTAGWTFDMVDTERFKNSLRDALTTYRQHKDSFR